MSILRKTHRGYRAGSRRGGKREPGLSRRLASPVFAGQSVVSAETIPFAFSHAVPGSAIDREFALNVGRWKRDTRHSSSVAKMVAHPSYRRIIGLGNAGLPLLFRELEERPDHWFVALTAMTGVDPVAPSSTFADAVKIWLAWGREKGYLDRQWTGTQTWSMISLDYETAAISSPVP